MTVRMAHPDQSLLTLDTLLNVRRYAEGLQLKPRVNAQSLLAGSSLSNFRGRGIDFDEVRHYLPGDDIATMDWRVTARTNKPHTKVYREERERPVLFLLDLSASMHFGTRSTFKSVIACITTAILAWTAVKQNDRVGGLLLSGERHRELRPLSGHHGALRLFQTMMLELQESPVVNNIHHFNQALLRMRHVARPGNLLIFFSDFYHCNEITENFIYQLRKHSDIIILFVFDPIEKEPPPPSRYTVTNGRELFQFQSADKNFCRHYRQLFNERYQRIESICLRNRILMIPIATNDDPAKTLQHYFYEKKSSW